MNKIKKIFTIILLLTFIFLLFKYNYILELSISNAVNLWIHKIFPMLFIMFILSDVIINTNIFDTLINFISPLFNKIFKVTGKSSLIFFFAILCGTPASSYVIKEMLENKQINLDDANKLIAFTYFANPLFLYNILKLTFNTFITFKIILIHYLSNIIIGLICRRKTNNTKFNNNYLNINNQKSKKNILVILPNAIKNSINTLLMILGTIAFYMIISNLLIAIYPLNSISQVIFKGLLEITQSLNILNTLNYISIIKEIIAISIISFGGLSIHTQVLTIINNTPINYKNFLVGRIYHVLISTFTYLIISLIIIG